MKRKLLAICVISYSGLNFSQPSSLLQNTNNINKSIEYRFDVTTLNTLGYGKEVADFYSTGNKFYPGRQNVKLNINNARDLYLNVVINDDGGLCLDDSVIKALSLRSQLNTSEPCPSINESYPNAKIQYSPANNTIDLVLPEEAFYVNPNKATSSDGGYAIFSNYDMYGMRYDYSDSRTIYHGQFMSGINVDNWVLRNQSNYSYGYEKNKYQFNETTLTRALENLNSSIQLGQISTYGNLYSGTTLSGIQLYSDNSFNSDDRLTVPVTGIAENDATLEISQNGRLLYRTLVSAGYYEVSNMRNVTQGQPLSVKLIENDGREKQYSVTTANIVSGNKDSSYLVSLGKYRAPSRSNDYETPFTINAEYGFNYTGIDYFTGAQVSDKYQSIAGRFNRQFEYIPFNTGMGLTLSRDDEKTGTQYDVNVMSAFGPFSVGFSGLYREKDYLTINESTLKNARTKYIDDLFDYELINNSRFTSSSMVSYMNPLLGNFGYTLSYTTYYGYDGDSVFHTISYGRNFGSIAVNFNYQARKNNGYTLFLSTSIPLGKRTKLTTRYQKRDGESSFNTAYSQRVGDDFSYSLGASKYEHNSSVNGSFNMTTPYNKLAGSTARTRQSFSSYMLSASGALGYADNLLVTSPYELGETFGVVHIPGQSGVEITSTGGEKTVTNYWGTAVIPRLTTYRKSTVNLSTKQLPLNVRLQTNSFDFNVSRGTVFAYKIDSMITKQLLLNVHVQDGSLAPNGTSVLDMSGKLISLITGQGDLMLVNDQIGMPLILRIPNKSECTLTYPIPDSFDPNRLYEVSDAICN